MRVPRRDYTAVGRWGGRAVGTREKRRKRRISLAATARRREYATAAKTAPAGALRWVRPGCRRPRSAGGTAERAVPHSHLEQPLSAGEYVSTMQRGKGSIRNFRSAVVDNGDKTDN